MDTFLPYGGDFVRHPCTRRWCVGGADVYSVTLSPQVEDPHLPPYNKSRLQ